jgi:hypothetical protein
MASTSGSTLNCARGTGEDGGWFMVYGYLPIGYEKQKSKEKTVTLSVIFQSPDFGFRLFRVQTSLSSFPVVFVDVLFFPGICDTEDIYGSENC